MFRVKESDSDRGISILRRTLQAALLLAFFANCGSVALILLEYFRFHARLDSSAMVPPEILESLRSEFGLQSILSILVCVLLLFSTGAIWWLGRRWFASQRTLVKLKMMAHDILASMDRGVITTDWDGTITSINSAATRILGIGFDCVGRPLADVASQDTGIIKLYGDVVERHAPVRDRDFAVERDGRRLRLRADGHVLADNEATAMGCVIYLRDVTDRVLLEERMVRMERFVSLATLASGLHHEIKNPLTALSIHVQLLEESLLSGEPLASAGELTYVLKTEVCRLNGVLETFRTFANLQRLAMQPTNVPAVIADVVRLIEPQASEQHVAVRTVSPAADFPLVLLDPDKFKQALLNLVINGLEAMPEGGELTIATSTADGELRVSVEDNGPEIPADVQRNLFQPYFSTKAAGSGMGLALSEKLIGQHGGRVEFRTGPVKTAFCMVVPLQKCDEIP